MRTKLKILMVLLIGVTVVSMLSGCQKVKDDKNIEIKLDENGYPLSNVIYLDSAEYTIPGEIFDEEKFSYEVEHELSKSKEVTVLLPVVMPIWTWKFDSSQDGVELLKEEIIYPEGDFQYDSEGTTERLQKFTIKVLQGSEIPVLNFKWINVNEEDKEFEDMFEHYLLNVKLK